MYTLKEQAMEVLKDYKHLTESTDEYASRLMEVN
jgi:hypothetical protein